MVYIVILSNMWNQYFGQKLDVDFGTGTEESLCAFSQWAVSPYFGIGALKIVAFILIGHLKR